LLQTELNARRKLASVEFNNNSTSINIESNV